MYSTDSPNRGGGRVIDNDTGKMERDKDQKDDGVPVRALSNNIGRRIVAIAGKSD